MGRLNWSKARRETLMRKHGSEYAFAYELRVKRIKSRKRVATRLTSLPWMRG